MDNKNREIVIMISVDVIKFIVNHKLLIKWCFKDIWFVERSWLSGRLNASYELKTEQVNMSYMLKDGDEVEYR